ncbi:phage portal protein [Clostridium botulinum]
MLNLSKLELKERKNANDDYRFYEGIPKDLDKLKSNDEWDKDNMIGQYWISNDDVDYEPTKDIRNKVKALLNKQKRFMFGKEPTILFKPYNPKDKEKCEELRQFIDNIFDSNDFWNESTKAFLESTIRKRVLLRCEINKDQAIYIYFNDINDFSYTINVLNPRKLDSVSLVFQDYDTINEEDTEKQIWNKYTYYLENNKCKLKAEIFKGSSLDKPIETKINDTGLNMLPFWIIKNGGTLNNSFGESDITDLKSSQTQYNEKISDFADNLEFNQFPPNILKDVEPVTNNVNEEVELKIAPNAIWNLKTSNNNGEGKTTGEVKKLETNFTALDAVERYLDRCERDMEKTLDMPSPQDIKNAPSAKAMKYIYNNLIARCEEKWRDWESPIKELIMTIIYACSKFNCYENWNHEWDNLKFKIIIKHNYPLIEDEDDKKKLALEEVNTNVRSHRSYIKDFADEEDFEGQFNEIIEDIQTINNAENDQFS